MPNLTSLSRKIATRLGAKSSTASWSRPVVRIATVGVAIGMALIVVATSIVHGFQQEVKELVVGFARRAQSFGLQDLICIRLEFPKKHKVLDQDLHLDRHLIRFHVGDDRAHRDRMSA